MTQSPPLDSRPARNRRAHKQTHVAHCLRSEIVEGQFHPGEQMPTFDQMEQRFGGSGEDRDPQHEALDDDSRGVGTRARYGIRRRCP